MDEAALQARVMRQLFGTRGTNNQAGSGNSSNNTKPDLSSSRIAKVAIIPSLATLCVRSIASAFTALDSDAITEDLRVYFHLLPPHITEQLAIEASRLRTLTHENFSLVCSATVKRLTVAGDFDPDFTNKCRGNINIGNVTNRAHSTLCQLLPRQQQELNKNSQCRQNRQSAVLDSGGFEDADAGWDWEQMADADADAGAGAATCSYTARSFPGDDEEDDLLSSPGSYDAVGCTRKLGSGISIGCSKWVGCTNLLSLDVTACRGMVTPRTSYNHFTKCVFVATGMDLHFLHLLCRHVPTLLHLGLTQCMDSSTGIPRILGSTTLGG
jgi:hypothetical protein